MDVRLLIRLLLASALSFGLVISPLPFVSSSSAAADLNLKSESQLKSEAALYDAAIREVERISSMKLADPDESKVAIAILKKHVPNLKFIRSKLIVLGLTDSTFIRAVKAKTGNDEKSAQEFAAELAKDRTAIFKVNGAGPLKDTIVQKVEVDTLLLRKVGEQLKRAAVAIRAEAKEHHAARSIPGLATAPMSVAPGTPAPLTPRLTDKDVATLVIVVAVIAFPPLGLALALIAANAVGILVAEVFVGEAIGLIGALKLATSTDKQKDAIAACQDKAGAAFEACDAAAQAAIFPLNIAAEDACLAAFLLNFAACLLI